MNSEYTHIKYEFEPVFDKNSKILILGTLPSVKSRENNFYYGHPQNRFWKLIARLCDEESLPKTINQKKDMLLRNNIAVWDVIAECDIIGSSDSSIKNVKTADLSVILNNTAVDRIYANGGKAYELYMKYQYEKTGMEIIKLPSTSPANAAYNLEKLLECWKIIKN